MTLYFIFLINNTNYSNSIIRKNKPVVIVGTGIMTGLTVLKLHGSKTCPNLNVLFFNCTTQKRRG